MVSTGILKSGKRVAAGKRSKLSKLKIANNNNVAVAA